jgi:hypothetical protein
LSVHFLGQGRVCLCNRGCLRTLLFVWVLIRGNCWWPCCMCMLDLMCLVCLVKQICTHIYIHLLTHTRVCKYVCMHACMHAEHILYAHIGWEEIAGSYEALVNHPEVLARNTRLEVYCLHSAIPTSQQQQVFKSTPAGVRKVTSPQVSCFDFSFVLQSYAQVDGPPASYLHSTSACMYVNLYINIYMYACVCVCIYIYLNMHKCINT